jgi:Icc-related predicted phosphoesterase
VIVVAAVADVHIDETMAGAFRPALQELPQNADILLLAGDLTNFGTPAEARLVAREFGQLAVPVVAVLGNHDYHSNEVPEVTAILRDAGITVLEGDGVVVECAGGRVGIGGVKGFGGGFAGAHGADFGEPEMKQFAHAGKASAEGLYDALARLDCDIRVAVTHYAPVPDTLAGERLEIYPFLGNYLLGDAIDNAGVTLAVHGHAHQGVLRGETLHGVPVRNVAYAVIQQPYVTFRITAAGRVEDHVEVPAASGVRLPDSDRGC